VLFSHLLGHPKFAEISFGEKSCLGVDSRNGREKRNERNEEPLEEHEDIPRPMVVLGARRQREERHRDRDEETTHTEREERACEKREIVSEDALTERLATEEEREPSKEREEEGCGRP
jgi:hypothetical protein